MAAPTIVVSNLDVDLHIEASGPTYYSVLLLRLYSSVNNATRFTLTRYHGSGSDKKWTWQVPGGAATYTPTDTATDEQGSIALALNGDAIDYVFTTPVQTVTGTVAAELVADESFDSVYLSMTGTQGPEVWCKGLTVTRRTPTVYPWNDAAELDAWTVTSAVSVAGGNLYPDAYVGAQANGSIIQTFKPQGVDALTALLSPPSIQRVAAVSGAGGLQDRYASGALADILTGSTADNHPELLHVGAGAHHLGLVWQRSNDIAMTTGTGVPGAGGWPNTVQTVALDRSKPTACVINPTHDVGLAYLQSGSIALFCPASWANGSYALGTESIISSGGVASERGQILWTPQGSLIYVYRNTDGDIVTKQSTDRGNTWS